MTFIEIYSRIIPFWGDKIDFSDGRIFDPESKKSGTVPLEDFPFQSDSLSRLWDGIENAIRNDDTFGDLMVWTMYQVFHRNARKLFLKNIFSLNPTVISKTEIEEQYYGNLQNESWEEELNDYERAID